MMIFALQGFTGAPRRQHPYGFHSACRSGDRSGAPRFAGESVVKTVIRPVQCNRTGLITNKYPTKRSGVVSCPYWRLLFSTRLIQVLQNFINLFQFLLKLFKEQHGILNGGSKGGCCSSTIFCWTLFPCRRPCSRLRTA